MDRPLESNGNWVESSRAAPALLLSVVAPPGHPIRVEQSVDLKQWDAWRTFTSAGRDEWELPRQAEGRFFRAVLDSNGENDLLSQTLRQAGSQ